MTKRPIRCIVAGFDPFGSATFNPSGEIALAFPDLITIPNFPDIPIEKLLLPTCCSESWKVLKAALKKFPDEDLVVVIAGLNQSGKSLHIERTAFNMRKYRIADNNGHKHPPSKIYWSEGELHRTRVPVFRIAHALNKNGFPCEISDHAGTFVCNEIYFRALSHQAEHKNVKSTLFIHVPQPETFASSVEEAKTKCITRGAKRTSAAAHATTASTSAHTTSASTSAAPGSSITGTEPASISRRSKRNAKNKAKSSEIESKSADGMDINDATTGKPKVERPKNPAHLTLLRDAMQLAVTECLKTSR